jgi:hypothetical protein
VALVGSRPTVDRVEKLVYKEPRGHQRYWEQSDSYRFPLGSTQTVLNDPIRPLERQSWHLLHPHHSPHTCNDQEQTNGTMV